MNLAEHLKALKEKGFSVEQAEVIVLIREAATILFREWPDRFVLFGGANLVLFHDSVRHSADLDLHLRGTLPSADEVAVILRRELDPLARLLEKSPLKVEIFCSDQDLLKAAVSFDGTTLFTVDLTRMGSVIQSGIDERILEGLGTPHAASIRFVSANLLLLQKAETFLMRKFLKARDPYDIRFLLDRGAVLNGHLHDNLADLILGSFDSEYISDRIAKLTIELCRAELKPFLPADIYEALGKVDFQPLKDGLLQLFGEWI